MDCRSYREANIDSDHYLVASTPRSLIWNSKNLSKTEEKKYNMRSFENPQIRADFEKNMNTRIQSINENTNTTSSHVNTYWEEIRDTYKTVTEEIVGT
ncbi:hypothetical protein HHI36_000730, partial [Cryptolaemus montrouzieri]